MDDASGAPSLADVPFGPTSRQIPDLVHVFISSDACPVVGIPALEFWLRTPVDERHVTTSMAGDALLLAILTRWYLGGRLLC